MIEVNSIPLIDNHCHPFLPEKEVEQPFPKFFTISFVPEVNAVDIENTVLYRRVIKELKRVLKAKSEKAAIESRMKLYHSNPREYISKLFGDANIDTLILDIGFPSEEYGSYSIKKEVFEQLMPSKIKWIYRIEPLLYRLFSQNLSFKDFLNEYIHSIENAIRNEGFCAIKTVIAYVYGLNIEEFDENKIETIYNEIKNKKELSIPPNEKTREMIKKEKTIREFLVFKALELSVKLNVPMQIHTGVGASPIIDVRDANPLNLINLITHPELSKAKIVLVHCGYPYVEEAGYLANQYPNVFVDLSEMNPFIGSGMKNKILSVLEMAPTTKVMYGSDGFNTPEVFWIASIICRESLGQAMEELINRGFIDIDFANKSIKLILRENAKSLYKI